jgi:peptidoglycan/LPS O-acetylase OafA/YrhL
MPEAARLQVLAAFSLRRNWRALWTRPRTQLPAADGLRALSFLWVFLFHVGWFSCLKVSARGFAELLERPSLRLLFCGDLGVDVFFTLSGFLIASQLLSELADRGTLKVGRFYLRRALRLLPAYGTVLWLYCRLGLPGADAVWANLLYVNNFLPVDRQCMAWSWSLAVEEQFYFLCPFALILLHRLPAAQRLRFALALLVVFSAVSYAVVITHHSTLPIILVESIDAPAARRYFDVLYDKTQVRAGALWIGVVAALLRQQPGVMAALVRHPRRARAGLCGAALLVAAVALAPSRSPTLIAPPRWLEVLYLGGFRYALAAAAGYLLLLCCADAGRGVARLLGRPALYPLAQLSYGGYLLHPLALIALYNLVPPIEPVRGRALLAYAAAALALSLGGALLLYLLVERPVLNLRAAWCPSPRPAGVAARTAPPARHPMAPGRRSTARRAAADPGPGAGEQTTG